MYSGEEALGLMESRVGITAESIPHLKDALNFIKNEDPRHISHNWGKVREKHEKLVFLLEARKIIYESLHLCNSLTQHFVFVLPNSEAAKVI